MPYVIHEQRETRLVDADRDAGGLWASFADLERATGWSLKPEGLCRDAICIPLRDNQRRELVRGDGDTARVNLSGLWQSLGAPVVSDTAGDAWVLGTAASARGEALTSLEAPDFMLTDLAGNTHTLAEQRGKKVFLATWAPW